MFKYLKSLIYTSGILLGRCIIITVLSYFNIVSGNILKIIELLIPIISIFIGSYILGMRCSNKGYIEGIKYGAIWILLFLVINIIFKNFTYLSLVYYLIFMVVSIFASIIGINKRKS